MVLIYWLLFYLFHLAIYAGLRLQFLLWNGAAFQSIDSASIAKAFWVGLRFDLAALAAPIGLYGLLLLFIYKKPKIHKGILFLFSALQLAFIVLNYMDAELVNFTARRFAASSLFLFQDAKASNVIAPYLGMVVVTLLTCLIYAFCMRIWFRKVGVLATTSTKRLAGFFFVILLSIVVFGRGGFQEKPITYVDAKIFDQTFANNLVLNSTFTFLKSFSRQSLERVHFFDQEKMLSLLVDQNVPSLVAPSKSAIELNQKPAINVVFLILESFSQEYIDLQNPEVTPFLNELKKKSVVFKESYANGRRSIEGIAAILSGIPALMEDPFINSQFSSNQVIGLGTLLKQKNYHTSFFHGAKNGSMHFDQFSKSIGFENYFGLSEYPDNSGNYNKSKDYDGTWGIYDEPFLQWTCEKFSSFSQPFSSVIFTLTSHQPYKIPLQFKESFADSRHEILPAIRYTDASLKKFFECAEKQNWFQNTVFIMTADHTGASLKESTEKMTVQAAFIEKFRVPLMIYSPNEKLLQGLSGDQVAQHIDLVPTVLDLVGIEQKNLNYLARSLYRPGPKVVALYSDQTYELVGQIQDKEQQLKAIRQYFSQGLYDNKLYFPTRKE